MLAWSPPARLDSWQRRGNERFVFEDFMSASNTTTVAIPSKTRSATTNNPLKGRRLGQSPAARRIRDLFGALMTRLGNPTDAVVIADVLALAELKTSAETARSRLLSGVDNDPDQLVRLENLVRRAERRLDLKPGRLPTVDFAAEMLRLATPTQAPTEPRAADATDAAADPNKRTTDAAPGPGGAV
jgi:hypothetical protein